jgi:alkyl hydroperoxide reductase subunit AhpC
LPGYEEHLSEFARLNAQVLGISTDNVFSIDGWCTSFGGLSYPVLSDFWPHGHTALKYGILRAEGITERAIFVIDRAGKIRYIDIHDINEVPPIEPIMHVLSEID